jgi:hypothetical protein
MERELGRAQEQKGKRPRCCGAEGITLRAGIMVTDNKQGKDIKRNRRKEKIEGTQKKRGREAVDSGFS